MSPQLGMLAKRSIFASLSMEVAALGGERSMSRQTSGWGRSPAESPLFS